MMTCIMWLHSSTLKKNLFFLQLIRIAATIIPTPWLICFKYQHCVLCVLRRKPLMYWTSFYRTNIIQHIHSCTLIKSHHHRPRLKSFPRTVLPSDHSSPSTPGSQAVYYWYDFMINRKYTHPGNLALSSVEFHSNSFW